MIGAFFLIIILFILTRSIFNFYEKKHSFFSKNLLNKLFFYHLFFWAIYYTYASFAPSDSKMYFERPTYSQNWFDYFGTGTISIDFISWPFINILNFNYEMMMLLYSWFGFLGFLFAYLFFRENIPLKVKVFRNLDFLGLILFLPNMHFWTASLGKGAPIFLGLMMFAYAIKKPNKRLFILVVGSILIYFIRPHIFLFVAVGTVLGYMSGRGKISLWKKVLVYITMIGILILVQDTILGVAGLEGSENLTEDFGQFSEDRSGELSSSGSGVDMSNYPLPLKFFTFWFRPLFFDAPGILGIIISVENLLYLLLFLKVFKSDFIKFVLKSPITVKMSLVIFLLASFAMTFVMSNLGIIIRQKSMVMYFAFFVIYFYLAQKKYDKILLNKKLKLAKEF